MGIFGVKTGRPQPPAPPAGLSIIAVGVTVHGDIDSNGTVKVEGTVDGSVATRQQVLIARGGAVSGDVDAREAVIGGTVRGTVRASERVEVQAGGAVHGDITTRRIAVAEGGILNGQVRMGEPPVTQAGTSPAAATPAPTPGRPSVPVARVAVPPHPPASH